MKKIAPSLLLLLLLYKISIGQSIIFNDDKDLYEIVDGTCTIKKINQGAVLPPDSRAFLYSIARYKDTIYILTTSNGLYRTTLSNPATAVFLGNIPLLTGSVSFCADKRGMLYGISDRTLYHFDPHNSKFDVVGNVPEQPGGDMIFYKDTLMYASLSGIIAVNMNNPPASQLIIPVPGYWLLGLVALPDDCTHNKLYGLGNGNGQPYPDLVEIDPETRTVIGPTCSIPYSLLDAASEAEDGTTRGVTVDSIFLQSPCGAATTGGAHIFAYTVSNGNLNYTLDGTTTNTTGAFDNLSLGPHTVHITSLNGGCVKDTSFTITQGLSDVVNISQSDPSDCYHLDGSIDVLASTATPPLHYSLNDGPLQLLPHFENLGSGTFKIKVVDGGHCEKELQASLHYIHPVTFLDHVTLTPARCTSGSGILHIILAPGVNAGDIQILLNGLPQSGLDTAGLHAGFYSMSIINAAGCKYDTTIEILSIPNDKPDIGVTVSDPVCLPDNGSAGISIDGINLPYTTSLDHAAYSATFNYTGITGGAHLLSVMDKDGCNWDTAITLHPYIIEPVTINVDSINPICKQLNSGEVTIHVNGSKSPYIMQYNGRAYTNGSTISGLNNGILTFYVINADGCTVDSVKTVLQLQMLPECDTFFIPRAFTPNRDGNNDVFRPIHSPYLTNYVMEVYNRWGQRVYADKDVHKGWDGTANGSPLPSGTYVWMIRYEDFEGRVKRLKGDVLLIR